MPRRDSHAPSCCAPSSGGGLLAPVAGGSTRASGTRRRRPRLRHRRHGCAAGDLKWRRRRSTGRRPSTRGRRSMRRPPPPTCTSRVCPLPAPSTGQSCSDRPSGTLCFYGDAEPSSCSIRCECRGQSWISRPPLRNRPVFRQPARPRFPVFDAHATLHLRDRLRAARIDVHDVRGRYPRPPGPVSRAAAPAMRARTDPRWRHDADAAVATRWRWRRRRQRHPVRHRAHLFRHGHLRDVEPVRRPGELPGRARWWTVSGGIDAVPRLSGRATGLHSRLPGSEL